MFQKILRKGKSISANLREINKVAQSHLRESLLIRITLVRGHESDSQFLMVGWCDPIFCLDFHLATFFNGFKL